jgi:hypothetical protein
VLNDIENLNDETVTLRGIAVPLVSDVGRAFICDAARNSEGLLNDGQITEKYGLTVGTWRQLVKNKALARAVARERERRVRTGVAAQEAAAELFAKAPAVLGDIMNNPYSSPRHKVEAIRELRQTAIGADSERTEAAADRFQITIILSEDEKIHINKPIAPLTPDEARESHHDDTEG